MHFLKSSAPVNHQPSEFLFRVRSALRSDEPVKRLAHFSFSKAFYALPATWRKALFAGKNNYCPICQSNLSRFLVLHRPYHHFCPVCHSLQRHRLGWLVLHSPGVQITQGPKRMLHIAPEDSFISRLSRVPGLEYVTADLFDPRAMVKLDICNIDLPDNSFDVLYCSHVLEHVPDDRKALSEFLRILKPGGIAVIMVPINAEFTFEDPTITDPFERLRVFKQHDHVRCYGPDFIERLTQAGFAAAMLRTEDIVSASEVSRMDLTPGEEIFLCRKEIPA